MQRAGWWTLDSLLDDSNRDSPVHVIAAGVGEWVDIVERARPAWWAAAACRWAPRDITWFPGRDPDLTMTTAAKAVCETCPALDACRTWALGQGSLLYGIWGGLTEKEREVVRRRRHQATGSDRRAS